MAAATNPYLEPVRGSTDEERDFAFVSVTALTETAAAAREWLLTDAVGLDTLGYSAREHTLHPEHVEARGVYVESFDRIEEIPDGLIPVLEMIRGGEVAAFWRFDISTAVSDSEEAAAAWSERFRAMAEQSRQAAIDWRGPWWWRARCWLADRFAAVGCWLDPEDRTSVSWLDGGDMHIAQVRRPR